MYPSMLFPGTTQYDWEQRETRIHAERILDSLNPVTWIRLVLKIRSHRPELVIFQWWQPFFAPCYATVSLLLQLCCKPRIIFLCHNVIPHERKHVDRLLLKLAFNSMVDGYIVHSKEDRTNLMRLGKKGRIRQTVHPTYEIFSAKQPPRDEAKHTLGLSGRVILFFGYIRQYKGLHHLLRALPAILRRIDVTLLVVGECYEDRAYYDELIESLSISEHVLFVDRYVPNDDIGTYFSASDIAVLPYEHATQSGIIQIAFGFNLPVITTDVGGLPEVVHNGRTGFVVAPRDPQALADAVVRFYMDDMGPVFSRNIREERHRFSWKKLATIIEEMAGTNSRHCTS
jgi:glycosyltransferase involved in cell wall biosynthesis